MAFSSQLGVSLLRRRASHGPGAKTATMYNTATRHLANTVRRYLSAIESAAQHVRRREQANCKNFLRYLDQEGRLDESTVGTWITRAGSARSEVRQRRLSTVRRLLAMTPGADAERLATWLDQNRQQLLQSGHTAKVVALRSPTEASKVEAEQCAEKAYVFREKGELERAEALARHALTHHPACLRAHALIGLLKLEANQPETALEQFRQALVLSGDPHDRNGIEGITDVLAGLGKTLLHLGCVDEAFEVYDRLRRAQTVHADDARAALGRIAFLKDEVDTAAQWFSKCSPTLQYNVYLARSLQGERFSAAIALARGIITNPQVPCMLLGIPNRYANMLAAEQQEEWERNAREFTEEWGDLWLRWPGIIERFKQDWESPVIRKFMMRIAPVFISSPTSPRLAVWIHRAATELQLDDTHRTPAAGKPAAITVLSLVADEGSDA